MKKIDFHKVPIGSIFYTISTAWPGNGIKYNEHKKVDASHGEAKYTHPTLGNRMGYYHFAPYKKVYIQKTI